MSKSTVNYVAGCDLQEAIMKKDGYRTERDSLGEVLIPSAAYYGAQTQRAWENFPISGQRPHPIFVWSVAVIKQAAAEVNGELGALDSNLTTAISQAAQEVLQGKMADQFIVDPFQAGAGTSHNMNVNEVIANRANESLGGELGAYKPIHPNDHVNMSQSTNDVIPTAIRLGALLLGDELIRITDSLAVSLRHKADEFDDVLKSGRTHLQDAVPVRLGQEFGAYAKALERGQEKLLLAEGSLRRLGIGGTAVGSGLNTRPGYHSAMVKKLSALSGLELAESDNLFESMQSMADIVFFSGAVRALAQDLIRIANDFRLLASGPTSGIDELHLPVLQPGSSIMPAKVNPVMAEMLDMVCFHVLGNDLAITMAAQAGQLELNVMMPIIAHNLFEEITILNNAMRAFEEKCVRGLQANRAKAAQWLERNPILITALTPLIGYEKGVEVAHEAMSSGKTIFEVVVEKGLLSPEEAGPLLDARRMTGGDLFQK
jgi:fumarate hydratase, class II